MNSKIYFPGVAAAVAGVIGLLGVYSSWWETADTLYKGTADVSGSLALAMSLGLFVFGGASVLMSDPRIRRAMNVLFALCALILALAALWATTRADEVATGAEAASPASGSRPSPVRWGSRRASARSPASRRRWPTSPTPTSASGPASPGSREHPARR